MNWATQNADVEIALRLGSALWRFWAIGGMLEEGQALLASAVALEGDVAPEIRAKASRRLGNMAVELADYVLARRCFSSSLLLALESGDPLTIARAQISSGFVAYHLGDYEEAQKLLELGLSPGEESNFLSERATALQAMGLVAYAVGRPVEAREYHLESRKIRGALGDAFGVAYSDLWLSQLVRDEGDYFQAELGIECALAQFDLGNEKLGVGLALHELAFLAYLKNDFPRASELIKRSLMCRKTTGDAQGATEALELYSIVLWHSCKFDSAIRAVAAAQAWRSGRGVPAVEPLKSAVESLLSEASARFPDSVAASLQSAKIWGIDETVTWAMAVRPSTAGDGKC